MSVTINDAHLKFNGEERRRETTSVIVLHHSGESVLQSVEIINDYYLHRRDPNGDTYIGIAYHYYVRKDGSIWKGRDEWAVGGHAGAVANPISIGICFEGDYEHEPAMPAAQLAAGQALIADIRTRYSGLVLKRHKDYMNTDCPGKNFPFDEMGQAPAAAKPAQPAPSGAQTVKPAFPGAALFKIGATNALFTAVGKALVKAGCGGHYKVGPGPTWSNADVANMADFQRRVCKFNAKTCDGIPGPQTWTVLQKWM